MPPLHQNHGRYAGETIEVDAVVQEIESLALDSGWIQLPIRVAPDVALPAWHYPGQKARRRVYLSSGIHGDEPAGPLAVLDLLGVQPWREDVAVWLCPCLNPAGFRLNRRENAAGLDLNRQYLHPAAPETRAHVAWLDEQPVFDVAICLHEDWEARGFYLYELNPDELPSHAERMIQAVAAVCPIDLSPEIDGRPAQGGIIRPSTDPGTRPEWPEAFYLLTQKTRLSYTLEAPSDFPMATRVAGLVAAVRAVLDAV